MHAVVSDRRRTPCGLPVPVVGEEAIGEHEPAPLVSLDVVGPLEQPTTELAGARLSFRHGCRSGLGN